MYIEEGISQQDFREHRSQIEAEKSHLITTVEVIKQHQHLVKADFEIALELCTQMNDLWEKGGFDGRRLLCETLFKEIHVEGGRIDRVVFNAPFSFIASHGGGSLTVPNGGAEGIRTPYPFLAKEMLSRMSYSPTKHYYSNKRLFRQFMFTRRVTLLFISW